MRRRIISLFLLLSFTIFLTGCSAIEKVKTLVDRTPLEEELLNNVPVMDDNSFNRFLFDLKITAGTFNTDGEEFAMSGALETYRRVSHLYNLKIDFRGTAYQPESWARFDTKERYVNMGDGWQTGEIKADHPVTDLWSAINGRETEMLLTNKDNVCTLSWTFPTDNEYLFKAIMEPYTENINLDGYGRITAVFDPETHEFEHFTVVISVVDNNQAGALLDAVLYWDEKNSKTKALEIPVDVSSAAYEASTGVGTDGGYDPKVNPMAEDFKKEYGGTAWLTHYEGGAHMFWALEGSPSAAVNYVAGNDADTRYTESLEFLNSFYGAPAEETENGAYYYSASKGELTYIGHMDDTFAEIIITGNPEMTQGELRKPLITYKSHLGI